MSDFWTKKNIPSPKVQPVAQQQPEEAPMELDQEALAEIQEEQYNVFEEEEDDLSLVLSDANLRLEQGRLYQMIINNDIFGETDADPKAIRNVQREIRKFARERMETMLGMRQEAPASQEVVVSSPFNDMEVTVLKMLASKMSKGATEQQEEPQQPLVQAPPKKDGLTAISGTTKPKQNTPLKKEVKPLARAAQPKQKPFQPKEEEEVGLKKPVEEMTPQELAEHNKIAAARQNGKYAKMPTGMMPMPTGQALEMLYANQAAASPGNAIANIVAMISQK